MARFNEINAQYFDDAGDPLSNGKIYFYETGTTTLKDTFSDINQTIANTNPVILTAAGRQPNIFFSGTAKSILVDKNDVQILVRDPVGQTASVFGDGWVATKIYSADAVVLGSDGQYYRSLAAGNQNNDPTSTSGYWTLLYSVEWNSGITYQEGAVVTYDGEQYQSLQNTNLNNNPSSATAYWVLLSFAWLSTRTYAINENAVGTDGILYTSLQNSNTGNIPASSPAYWVGTSAAAAASAVSAAASAAAALVSENAAELAETNAETAQVAAEAAQAAAETAQVNAETAETNSLASSVSSATSASQSSASAAAALVSQNASATSETNSAASAVAAASSASGASGSESAAAASAAAALVSENASAASASSSAASAGTSASEASSSAASAASSASSATASAGSATAASGSATAASGSAVTAAGSATAAAGSATAASDKYDEFDARYLGEKASDPSVDNQGGALVEGALYFNTTSDAMKVYDGAAWVSVAPVATSVTVSQISDYTGTATTLNYTSNLTSDAQTQLDTKAVYPSQTGNSGKYLTTDGSSTSWGVISAIAEPTVISTNTAATSGQFLVVDTAGITITLPATPSAGDYVIVKDGTGAAATSTFTVARNGSNIASSATDLIFDKNYAEITMTYIDGTIGWSV